MKTTLRLALLLCFLFLQGRLLANTVIVKGTVKNTANQSIANKKVKIYSTDSSNGGCAMVHYTFTNPNGYYIDTLTCSGEIRKLMIFVENCDGTMLSRDPAVVGTGNLVEVNFVICDNQPVPARCKAAFSYQSLTTGVKFNGAGASTAPGDSIISRTWTFGDSSTALMGNRVDPLHEYAKPGIYKVCLTITTKSGCQSSYCQTVVFTPASNDCKVNAAINFEKIGPRKFRFSSSQSNTLEGDSIFQRIWKFSDGSSLDGNQINPLKEFRENGVYDVCLIIHTVKGCEKKICISVTVKDTVPGTTPPATHCKVKLGFAIQGNTVKFNSSNSSAAAGDSIILRAWKFGDTSLTLTGNRIDPSHTYSKPGKYTACLYIKTKNGCENKTCVEFEIRDTLTAPRTCKAYFSWHIKDSLVIFNSAESRGATPSDSVISRTWYYADSSVSVSLGGNVIAPSYPYTKPGNYPVYLEIKTKSGCESKYVATVTIKPPSNCKAYFTWSTKDSLVIFNSSESKGTSPSDSIISRKWYYADNNTMVTLGGNVISPSYPYTKPGTYTVHLLIKTQAGCENKFSSAVTIKPSAGIENCKAAFKYSQQNGVVLFNSSKSKGSTITDSIIGRTWFFGDSTAPLQGNIIDPSHSYAKAGKYFVKLYIKTKGGCESKYSETISVSTVNCPVEVKFSAERISLKKVSFNSSQSKTLPGDSIIQRVWKFGDNTILSGNEISTVKEFPLMGVYTTCLQVKTINGCEAKECKPVVIQDTLNTPPANVNEIKIINLNPNPVITRMMATIYSRSNNNTEAEITIYDIYGTAKLRIKKMLQQGNNMIEIGCEFLYHGPYFLKVTTKSGRDTKAFYKL